MVIYTTRILHQENNLNIFHRMIGGMEDEEWEIRRRREWDARRAEENEKWEIQKRKVANRRERDDAMKRTLGNNGTFNNRHRI